MRYNFERFCEASLNRFFRSTQPAFAQLGPLEQRLMQEIWTRGHATVRELLRSGNLGIAYTTVMTTLDRMAAKGLVCRRKSNRRFIYGACLSHAELEAVIDRELLARLIARPQASREFILSSLLLASDRNDPLHADRQ